MKRALITPKKTVARIFADSFDHVVGGAVEISDELAAQSQALLEAKDIPILFEGVITSKKAERQAGHNLSWSAELADYVRTPIPAQVPKFITAWQAKAAMELTPYVDGTLFDAVSALIAGMPDGPQKIVLSNAVGAADFVRASQAISDLSAQLGLTSDQVDQVFLLGAALKSYVA